MSAEIKNLHNLSFPSSPSAEIVQTKKMNSQRENTGQSALAKEHSLIFENGSDIKLEPASGTTTANGRYPKRHAS